MDVRENLVELLKEAKKEYEHISNFNAGITNPEEFVIELIANHLIAHGVTVQEWISVNDRLPKLYDKDSDWSVTVLFRTTQGHIHSGRRKFGRHRMSYWVDEADNLFFSKEEVTHWMPLPAPPKGE